LVKDNAAAMAQTSLSFMQLSDRTTGKRRDFAITQLYRREPARLQPVDACIMIPATSSMNEAIAPLRNAEAKARPPLEFACLQASIPPTMQSRFQFMAHD